MISAVFRPSFNRLLLTLACVCGQLLATSAMAKLSKSEKAFLENYDSFKIYNKLEKKKKQRAAERLLPFLVELQGYLEEQTEAGTVSELTRSKKIRANLFHLEAAMKLYEKMYGPEFEQLKILVKRYEDVVGKWEAYFEFIDFAEKVGADPKAIQYLQSSQDEALATLEQEVAANWTIKEGKSHGISTILDTFLKSKDIQSNKKDSLALIKQVDKKLLKLAEIDLPMDHLEEGLHELRRKIRWIALYFNATDGVFELTKAEGNSQNEFYNSLLNSEIRNSPYSKIRSTGREKVTVEISKPYFYAINHYIKLLGDIKDVGQSQEFIAIAYVEAGLAKDLLEAEHLVDELVGEDATPLSEIIEQSKAVDAKIKAENLFDLVREDIAASLD